MGFKLFYDEDVNLFGPGAGAHDPARGALRVLPVTPRGLTRLGSVLHPAFADHHVHLGLIDPVALAASGIGRVVDLGWSDDVVALAGSAPVPGVVRRPVRRRSRRLPERQPVGAAALHQRGRRAARRGRGRRPPGGARRVGGEGDPQPRGRCRCPTWRRSGRWSPRRPWRGFRSSRTARGRAWSSSRWPAGSPRSRTRRGPTGSTTRWSPRRWTPGRRGSARSTSTATARRPPTRTAPSTTWGASTPPAAGCSTAPTSATDRCPSRSTRARSRCSSAPGCRTTPCWPR